MTDIVLVYDFTAYGSNYSLRLPISVGTITSINWGDGTTTTDQTKIHTYAGVGPYTITISGTGITEMQYNSPATGTAYLIQCTSFGGLTSAQNMFKNCVRLTSVPAALPAAITNLQSMFLEASSFNGDISGWVTTNVTNMNSMFDGATSFNQNISSWNTSSVTDMSQMFSGTPFNQDISSWDVSSVTNMGVMFYANIVFNQNIGGWDVSSVIYMTNMFNGATSFNQNLGGWDVSGVMYMNGMMTSTALSTTNYNALLTGWAAQTLQSGVEFGANGLTYYAIAAHNTLTNAPNNWTILGDTYLPYPCFKEGSKILTDKGYKTIETLRKGDLVKTLKNGYKPIDMIGKRVIYNSSVKERIKEQLYKCSKDKYPELTEDLVITGCHSILVDKFNNQKQREKTIEVNGDAYVTDNKYRLPACVDDRASVYEVKGDFTIYHIALENADYYMNYGVYANGLLVETCSKRYLKELSNMELI